MYRLMHHVTIITPAMRYTVMTPLTKMKRRIFSENDMKGLVDFVERCPEL